MPVEVFTELLGPCQLCGRVHVQIQSNAPDDQMVSLERAVAALTPQEYEVFVRMSGGWSNHELASALYVTEHTIKAHVGKIRRKLPASTREKIMIVANIYNAWRCAMAQATVDGDGRSV